MFFYLIFIIIALVQAETKFVWKQMKPGRLEAGVCLEVDEKVDLKDFYSSEINHYAKKVSADKCKPKGKNNTSYFFNYEMGRCFEGDNQSSGRSYFVSADIKNCRTDTLEIKNLNIKGNFGCYEIDSKSEGGAYYNKLNPKECAVEDALYMWERRDLKSGRCFGLDKETKQKYKTKNSFCRPAKPIYRFVRTAPFSGTCLEQSPNDYNQYSLSVKVTFCRPENTSFIFYKKEKEVNGKCYEVDTKTKGDQYIGIVSAEKCK